MSELYLAVNKDGTEIASNEMLERAWEKMENDSTPSYRDTHPMERYIYPDQWIDTVESTDYGYYGTDYSFNGIELPSGTIEKLTGKKMTWFDKPVKITF